jgi:DNA-binding response OmpR family regulator
MKILIAEDNPVTRRLLEVTLTGWGYDVVLAIDGLEAWKALQGEEAPSLAILDWMMPGMDGIQVCQEVRRMPRSTPTYIILLTSKSNKEEIVEGLEAGGDDYITKPFHREELHARLRVGERVIELQRSLANRVRELENALLQVKQLKGLFPICSYCKKIRNDANYWQQVESYIAEHSEAQFSHGICPDCYEKFVTPELQKLELKSFLKG